MLKFFYAPNSSSLAAMLALEEAGAEYEAVRIDFSKGEQRQQPYLAINPKGRVPALVTERGILTENMAILAYIAQAFPEARLAPSDPFEFARMQEFNAYLAATVHVAHAHKLRGARWADDPAALEAMKAKVSRNMADCCAIIEARPGFGPWVMGGQFTVADPYLFTISSWLAGDGVDIAGYPVLEAHHARMQARPAVIRALARQG